MSYTLLQAPLVLAAVATISISPFGRRTLREVRRDGLTLRHARHVLQTMVAVALLVAVVAALNLR